VLCTNICNKRLATKLLSWVYSKYKVCFGKFLNKGSRLHLVHIHTETGVNRSTKNLLHRDEEYSNISVCRR